MGKRGQASSEYLGIIIIVLIILVPVLILYMRYSGETNDAVASSKIDSVTNEISKASNQVFVYGEGTQNTVTVDFPSGINSIIMGGATYTGVTPAILSGPNEIVFVLKNSKNKIYEVVKVVDSKFLLKKIDTVPRGRTKLVVRACAGQKVEICINSCTGTC